MYCVESTVSVRIQASTGTYFGRSHTFDTHEYMAQDLVHLPYMTDTIEVNLNDCIGSVR